MMDIKDINIKPTIKDIEAYIGISLFKEFYQYLMEEYQAICTIQYSKDVWLKGWNIKFKKAGKSLCVIYPKRNYFTVLVVVGKKEKATVEALLPSLTKEINNIYDETKEGMNQRWLMIDLKDNGELYQDILKLIHIRRTIK